MNRLLLMLDTALAYVFMLMFWRSHLFSVDYAYAFACAHALVKTSLNGGRFEAFFKRVTQCS